LQDRLNFFLLPSYLSPNGHSIIFTFLYTSFSATLILEIEAFVIVSESFDVFRWREKEASGFQASSGGKGLAMVTPL